ncbi:MAG: hypothetical protein V9F04_17285 [Dermatophilaceae bacterium]
MEIWKAGSLLTDCSTTTPSMRTVPPSGIPDTPVISAAEVVPEGVGPGMEAGSLTCIRRGGPRPSAKATTERYDHDANSRGTW